MFCVHPRGVTCSVASTSSWLAGADSRTDLTVCTHPFLHHTFHFLIFIQNMRLTHPLLFLTVYHLISKPFPLVSFFTPFIRVLSTHFSPMVLRPPPPCSPLLTLPSQLKVSTMPSRMAVALSTRRLMRGGRSPLAPMRRLSDGAWSITERAIERVYSCRDSRGNAGATARADGGEGAPRSASAAAGERASGRCGGGHGHAGWARRRSRKDSSQISLETC